MANKSKRLEAQVKYSGAQVEESKARTSRPGALHENVPAALRAKEKAVEAMDEIARIDGVGIAGAGGAGGDEEDTVTLTAPNPHANVTDANGVVFKDGKAEGVPRGLAEYYEREFEGYSVGGGSGGQSAKSGK